MGVSKPLSKCENGWVIRGISSKAPLSKTSGKSWNRLLIPLPALSNNDSDVDQIFLISDNPNCIQRCNTMQQV